MKYFWSVLHVGGIVYISYEFVHSLECCLLCILISWMQGATNGFVSSLYEETKPQWHNDATGDAWIADPRANTVREWNLLFSEALCLCTVQSIPARKMQQPDCRRMPEDCSEQNKTVLLRLLCVRERSSISSSFPRYSLKDIKWYSRNARSVAE